MADMAAVPVITIDGPSGTGKGTIAQLLAEELGWHLLDSGALYRIVGLAALRAGVLPTDSRGLCALAAAMHIEFSSSFPGSITLNGKEISAEVRLEETGAMASKVAADPGLRAALLQRQHDFRRAPGLVADGRDMGTVIFPDAPCKFFLTASAQIRAERRYKQLKDKEVNVSLPALLRDIQTRDERDSTRAVAPLKPAEGALIIDTGPLSVQEVMNRVRAHASAIFGADLGTYSGKPQN
jgi:cytidylate kinase